MNLEKLDAASTEIAREIGEHYRDERGAHAETTIGAAAALAGEYALKASVEKLPPSGWIVGAPADELLYLGEASNRVTLWSFLRLSAKAANVPESDIPNPFEVAIQISNAIASSPFPPLTIPERHYPREWSPEACPRLRGMVNRVAAERGLTPAETAFSIAMAIAKLINQAKQLVPPQILIRLAAEVMIGVSRMAPLPDDYERSSIN